jgi:hypothetical protein
MSVRARFTAGLGTVKDVQFVECHSGQLAFFLGCAG